jgi:hypothetical protein
MAGDSWDAGLSGLGVASSIMPATRRKLMLAPPLSSKATTWAPSYDGSVDCPWEASKSAIALPACYQNGRFQETRARNLL